MNQITYGLGGIAIITMGLGISIYRGGSTRIYPLTGKVEFIDEPGQVSFEPGDEFQDKPGQVSFEPDMKGMRFRDGKRS